MNVNEEGSPYQIQTFVFLDLETMGFDDKPRILELSMIAVSRSDLLYMQEKRLDVDGEPEDLPRIMHKYTKLYYPRKLITPQIEEITGLSNYNLNHLPMFQADNATEFNYFIKHFPSPVCLVAHNGLAFDFPIVKAELLGVNANLMTGLVCADSLIFVRNFEKEDIKRIIDLAKEFKDDDFQGIHETIHENDHSTQPNGIENVSPSLSRLVDNGPSLSRLVDNGPSVSFSSSGLGDLTFPDSEIRKTIFGTPQKLVNNSVSTPPNPKKKIHLSPSNTPNNYTLNHNVNDKVNHYSNVRRALYHNEEPTIIKKPFSQPILYHRIFRKQYKAHRAEADAVALLQICAFHGQEFITWSDQNFTPFESIKARWNTRRTFTL